jgi:hypothetical protein
MVMLYAGRIRAQGTVDELLRDTQRTVIETPPLSAETISKIERVIEQAEGKGIEKVEVPRQRLEQFFMELVERAQAEQIETAGAVHGGSTADFLLADESRGEQLIDTLVSERDQPVRSREAAAEISEVAAVADAPPSDEVLAELLTEEPPGVAPLTASESAPMPEAPADVDDSVIEGLLGGQETTKPSEGEKAPD